MIRVLHSVSNMDRGGIETMLMNYYRHIDRSKVQFDFIVNKKKPGFFDNEIRALGGRIFQSPGVAPQSYPAYLRSMQQLLAQHPEIKVDVLVQGSELAAALEEDRIQLAIVDENCARGFQWTPLTDAPLVAVTPKDFPWTESTISLARLLQEPFLSCPEQYVEQYLPADTPRLEVAASDDGAILSMVAGGLGVSVLSAFSLAGYENRVRVIPLDRPLSRRLGVAVKSMPAATSPARLFLAFLKRQYQTAAQEK